MSPLTTWPKRPAFLASQAGARPRTARPRRRTARAMRSRGRRSPSLRRPARPSRRAQQSPALRTALPQRARRPPCLRACLQRWEPTWSRRRGLPGRAAAVRAMRQGKGRTQTLALLGRAAPWALAALARRPARVRRRLRPPPPPPLRPPRLPPRPRRWRRCRRWRPRAQGTRRPTRETGLLRGTARRRRLPRVPVGGRRQGARAPAQRRRSGRRPAHGRAWRGAVRRLPRRARPRPRGWALMRRRRR